MNKEATKSSLIITQEDLHNFKRLDLYLMSKLDGHSRNQIKSFFEKGFFKSNNKLSLKKMPSQGTKILFDLPEISEIEVIPQDIPLDILFEDEHLIMINKPAGMVVHPAPGNWDQTLVNALLFHCKDLKGIGHERRPGIVHRLDKGTSGVMVAAKDQKTHNGLIELFSTHSIKREYQAIVIGPGLEQYRHVKSTIGRSPQNRLKMQANVSNGKEAITYFHLQKSETPIHHIKCQLETGRTHQIRVHCSQILNHPILMDPLYGNVKQNLERLTQEQRDILNEYPHPLLHARILGFIHPITQEEVFIEQEPPQIFRDVLDTFRQGE